MKKELAEFTRSFSDCVGAGIPAGKALSLIQENTRLSLRVRRAAGEAKDALLGGSSLSFAFSSATAMRFPEWYASFVSLSEENGNLCGIMSHLEKVLAASKKAREQFWAALLYPLCVAVLAFGASVFLMNVVGGSLFSGERLEMYRSAAWKSIGMAVAFFALFVLVLAVVFSKIMGRSALVEMLNALSFLTDCGVPLVQAIDSAGAAVGGQKRVARAFSRMSAGISAGGVVSDVFSVCLSEARFPAAARIVSAHLEVCQTTGTAGALKSAVSELESRRERLKAAAVALEPPPLMGAAAVYFVLLLKDTVLPFVLGGMDFL